jgi:hypothetical protein
MTIDEAIELIEHCAKTHARYDRVEIKAALQLGIEALKFRQRWEQQEGEDDFPRLPGETDG